MCKEVHNNAGNNGCPLFIKKHGLNCNGPGGNTGSAYCTIQRAITLIVLGVAIVIDKITGSDWYGSALNLWPLLLIAIGAEIIWRNQINAQTDAGAISIDLD